MGIGRTLLPPTARALVRTLVRTERAPPEARPGVARATTGAVAAACATLAIVKSESTVCRRSLRRGESSETVGLRKGGLP